MGTDGGGDEAAREHVLGHSVLPREVERREPVGG